MGILSGSRAGSNAGPVGVTVITNRPGSAAGPGRRPPPRTEGVPEHDPELCGLELGCGWACPRCEAERPARERAEQEADERYLRQKERQRALAALPPAIAAELRWYRKALRVLTRDVDDVMAAVVALEGRR